MNSCNTDIFFSNYYHLQSVRFELHHGMSITNFLLVHSSSYQEKAWVSLLLSALEFYETPMMSFSLYCMLFGILVFCPETGEIWYLNTLM